MEPPSKRTCVAADDRLSDLPDCLIHSILSFLESRQVVRSSVLSRRWRHLWRSVPCIDIDLTVFRQGGICVDRECCKRNWVWAIRQVCNKEWRSLVEFSDNFLRLNNCRSLDKLRIHIQALDSHDREAIQPVLRWIMAGVRRSPAVIDIHTDSYTSWGDCCLPDLGPASSSRLTRLFLHGVKLDGGFPEQLRSGCLVLEKLSLVRCSCHFSEIMSTSLRYLTIDDCSDHLRDGVVVTAPRLTSLHTSFATDVCPNGICVTDTSFFVKASICVTTYWKMNANFWDKVYNTFNVMHLELHGAAMMDGIGKMPDKLPKFQNVRTLLINRCYLIANENIQALDRLLQNSPGLKRLTLQNCLYPVFSKTRTARAKWRHVALESQNLMSFKCENLEVVEIKHSKDVSVDELFELLMGLWRNLGKSNIKITQV